MAEGHAVVRWARGLRRLVGSPLTRVDTPKRWAERGQRLLGEHLTKVRTHGKHLLLHTSCELTIHCHAMMYGSWQFGGPGMALRKPERQVRLRLRTPDREAVFFNGPVMELLAEEELATHERLRRLGYFNQDYVRKILYDHYAGTANPVAQIWNLICFQIWYEAVVDGGA